MLQSLLALVRRLARPADPAFCLVKNAREDPLESVRLVNLKLLVREYPGKPATLETLRAALSDPGYGLRFRAASELGAEGQDTLLEIAADGSAPQSTQVGALRAVGARLPLESALEALSHALRTRRVQAAEACLVTLGLLGGPDVVDPLARVLALERGRLAATAARALGLSGQPAAETPLVAGLQRQEVALASAVALGKVGSVAAVEPLRKAESAASDDSLRRAAREAVAEIHSRLSGASPGQLSLTEEEAGQVSLAEDETGRVSLPDPGPVAPDGRRGRTS
jgi:HEAT repeat protein